MTAALPEEERRARIKACGKKHQETWFRAAVPHDVMAHLDASPRAETLGAEVQGAGGDVRLDTNLGCGGNWKRARRVE